ncbi:MAG: TIGR03619 family F420-dependent LLM class oxidoreductase [Candidatus Dormibacteria bacterium]
MDRPARLSIVLKSFSSEAEPDWTPLFNHARAADDAGVDRVVVPDHVVFGEHMEAYGRPELGGRLGATQPTDADGHWLEPLTTLSVICGMTSRTRLGTSIMIAALRRPAVLAKAAATLDVLSGGRLDLGVGVGWQREEYEAAGLRFEDRGRLLNETLAVCQSLWREWRAEYRSADLEFSGIHMMPKPSQPGGVPLWVGGSVTSQVAQRLARFGTGWIPWGTAADDILSAFREMAELLTGAGRDPASVLVEAPLPILLATDGGLDLERTMDVVPRLIKGGVTDFRARVALPYDRAKATEILHEVVSAFRASAGVTELE